MSEGPLFRRIGTHVIKFICLQKSNQASTYLNLNELKLCLLQEILKYCS